MSLMIPRLNISSVFSHKPTLDRSVLNSYKKCLAAQQVSHADEIKGMKASGEINQLSGSQGRIAAQKFVNPSNNFRQSYGIGSCQDLSDFPVVN